MDDKDKRELAGRTDQFGFWSEMAGASDTSSDDGVARLEPLVDELNQLSVETYRLVSNESDYAVLAEDNRNPTGSGSPEELARQLETAIVALEQHESGE